MTAEFYFLLELCAETRGLKLNNDFTNCKYIDENILLDIIEYHKVTELAYKSILPSRSKISKDTFDILKKRTMQKQLRKEILLSEWKNISSEINGQQIPLISFKGPALALQYLGDPRAREFGDLDFIADMPNKKMYSLIPVFNKLGYELDESFYAKTSKQSQFIFNTMFHLMLVKKSLGVLLEIHSSDMISFKNIFNIPVKDLFLRSKIINWQNIDYLTLSPTDHAICVLAHTAKHSFCTINWLLDAACIFQNIDKLDLELMKYLIFNYDLHRIIAQTKMLIETFFILPISDDLFKINKYAFVSVKYLFKYSYNALNTCNKLFNKNNLYKITYLKYLLVLKNNILYKLRIIKQILTPNNFDLSKINLPDPLLFLIWILRPFLLIIRWLT